MDPKLSQSAINVVVFEGDLLAYQAKRSPSKTQSSIIQEEFPQMAFSMEKVEIWRNILYPLLYALRV